jgi:hypothetical protein
LFVKLSRSDKRRRRKQRKLEENRPSKAELRERALCRRLAYLDDPFQVAPGATRAS